MGWVGPHPLIHPLMWVPAAACGRPHPQLLGAGAFQLQLNYSPRDGEYAEARWGVWWGWSTVAGFGASWLSWPRDPYSLACLEQGGMPPRPIHAA